MRSVTVSSVMLTLALLLQGCASGGGLSAFAPTLQAGGRNVAIGEQGVLGEPVSQLPDTDRRRALGAEYRALEFSSVGDPVEWRGRRGSGTVTALAPYQVGSQNCRQLSHSYTIDGREGVAKGSACRDANGSWTPLS